MIPLAAPLIEADDLDAVSAALSSGMLVQGPRVAAFESALSDVTHTRYVVAVSSGTAALHLAMMALDIGPGSRVAVPAYSWPATANVVAACGAHPVFVDIESQTWAMSPEHLARIVAEAPVDVILPVHAFGQVGPMSELVAAAGNADMVEDAACALAAARDGRRAGSFGRLGCFSFHPRKAITTCEGGAVATSDEGIVRRLRALRNHGQDPESDTPDFVLPGLNYRLTEVQAALGCSQLGKLDRILADRRQRAATYDMLLSGSDVLAPEVAMGGEPVYQSYVVLLPPGSDRAGVITSLRADGIEAQIGTWHIPLVRYYRERYGYSRGDFPVTDDVFARSLSLPMPPALTVSEQERVVNLLLGAL